MVQFCKDVFLSAAQEPNMSAADIAFCRDRWRTWVDSASLRSVLMENQSLLALWLAGHIEDEVDKAWATSPSLGFRLNALALTFCMAGTAERLPQVAARGCAPRPELSSVTASLLIAAGVPLQERSSGYVFTRRYAVLTYFPYRRGCDICALHKNCPGLAEAVSKASFFSTCSSGRSVTP